MRERVDVPSGIRQRRYQLDLPVGCFPEFPARWVQLPEVAPTTIDLLSRRRMGRRYPFPQPKVLPKPTPMQVSAPAIFGKGGNSRCSTIPGVTNRCQPGFNATAPSSQCRVTSQTSFPLTCSVRHTKPRSHEAVSIGITQVGATKKVLIPG